jgi:hypothetical protein
MSPDGGIRLRRTVQKAMDLLQSMEIHVLAAADRVGDVHLDPSEFGCRIDQAHDPKPSRCRYADTEWNVVVRDPEKWATYVRDVYTKFLETVPGSPKQAYLRGGLRGCQKSWVDLCIEQFVSLLARLNPRRSRRETLSNIDCLWSQRNMWDEE